MITDLTVLLKGKEGIKLYSPMFGECTLHSISEEGTTYEIEVLDNNSNNYSFTKEGYYIHKIGNLNPECLLFPSKDNRDWSTFNYRWRADFNKTYFTVDGNCHVFPKRDVCSINDDEKYMIGNYFKTLKEAEEAANKIRNLWNTLI